MHSLDHTQAGELIVIDGGDGSGKTEQTKLLVERLIKEGYPTETVAFPRYGHKSAGPVEDYLAKKYGEVGPYAASIFYAVDRFAASCDEASAMHAKLAAGTILVANRYVGSNMGHQGAKIDDSAERMAYFRWNDDLEHRIFGIPRPSMNVVLHVPADIAMSLIDKRGNAKDAHENIAHLTRAEATYLEIARTFPGFVLVECVEDGRLLSIPEVHERVWAVVAPRLRVRT